MGLADTAKLVVDLSLKGNFNSQLKASERALGSFDAKLSQTEGRAYKAGQQIGTGIKNAAVIAAVGVGALASQVAAGLASLARLDDVVTQSNAVLKSTGGVAGQTAQSVRNLANKYEDLNATIDDTVIQSGENLLLTFTNIRKQAFEPTLQAALDMNQALGRGEEGLTGTIQQLGVALNDPIVGLTRLRRAGIVFTESQKAQIEAAVKAGDTFKAQGIILAELNKRYGGSFLAGGSTTTGKIAKFKDAIDDLQRVLATALLPVIGKVADGLSKFLSDPKVIKAANDLGQSIADLFNDKNIAEGGRILGTLFDTAKAAAPVVRGAAEATLNIVKAAVGIFRSLPEGIQQLAIGAFAINKLTGGLVTNVGGAIAGGIADAVLRKFAGVVNVSGAVVNVVGGGGVPGVPGAPPAPIGPAAAEGGIAGAFKTFLKNAGVAAAFGGAVAVAIDEGQKKGIIDAEGHVTKAAFGLKTTVPGSINPLPAFLKALGSQGLLGAVDKASSAAEMNARRIEAAENRSSHAVVSKVATLGQKVDAAKAKIAADARHAGVQTSQAIKDKKLSVTIPITNITTVSLRDFTLSAKSASRLGHIGGV